ncbi:ATP-binding protein [Arthrobacter sp. AL12]|uniref:ATP-binding protein n=1 Tax=Arthrobacter sp. AL12 TaxID=3042241 RepID=UPI00249AFEB0|nr:ATP-binding protein [Arthrobacter sp. AL12]MDI3213220.1 ATP-binding protein [Arthrobacter sp. AL12]
MAKFLTSARAVDMLGRQQIAGIPTAVSEIFKNAYDAYATTVRGDYFPATRVLTVRDDGVGMSFDDFTSRWLTIGTDSKARDSTRPLPSVPSGFKIRRQMGEKGIGRLAIASIGSQMLIVTRAREKVGTAEDEVVVALLQWSIFEVPGLTLDDVVIPIRRLKDISELNSSLVAELAEEIYESIDQLGTRIGTDRRLQIMEELRVLPFDPSRFLSLNGPSLARNGGTAFIVAPANDDLESVITSGPDKENGGIVSPFQRFLMGFSNTITGNSEDSDLVTEFILHAQDGPVDLIDPASFWRPEDFETTDHTVEGQFDEYGTFSGRVSIYGSEPIHLVESWPANRGAKTNCGPFRIKFGYVQGEQSGSRLNAEDFALMTSRLQRLGGLYIYRDGIRVLPYGNSDTDYLEMEQRRTKNAGRYYFSYRRIFGAIEIDSINNPGLQEKAGREGFRENAAYRDFTDVLKGFLVQLAANFFSGKTQDSEEFRRQRQRLKDRFTARSEAEDEERRAREAFAASLESQLSEFESGRFAALVTRVVEEAVVEKQKTISQRGDSESGELIRTRAAGVLNELMQSFDLTRPTGVGLTAVQEREYASYIRARAQAAEIIERGARQLDLLATSERSVSIDSLSDQRLRIERAGQAGHQDLQEAYKSVDSAIALAAQNTLDAAQQEVRAFSDALDRIASNLPDRISTAKELRTLDEIRIEAALRRGNLQDLLHLLAAVETGSSSLSDKTSLQEQILDLQEQVEGNLELMQLGQAVQIVSHEFEASIRTVRSGLQKLSPWARSTPRLEPIVRDLRASFAHLDGYLRLFTPLQRRLYRQKVVITGSQISEFVRGVFFERFERHNVRFEVAESFLNWQFRGFPSTFYPVFVNLIDNAIAWTSNNHGRTGVILLDADEDGLLVCDDGPGIRPRDRDAIFERGFSRRRGGRGLGLSLSRELLARDGWEIELEFDEATVGAKFRIRPTALQNEMGTA